VADGEELRRKHVIPERGWSASFQRFCEEIQVTRFENSASWVAPMERWIKHQVAEGLASRLTRTQLAHWIQANRAKIESDNPYKITPDDPSQPGLTLLTLHGSKGLEFRHVYLPELFERVSAQQEGSLEGDDGDVLLKIALKKERGVARRSLAYDLRKIDKLQAEYAEQKRLLYVALTRAIEGLHVIGHVAGEEKKKSEPLAVLGVPRARPEYWNHALQAIALEGVAETRFVESSVDGNGENAKDPKVWIYPRPFVPVNPATESFHRCGVSKYLQLSSESEEDEERASAKELKHGRASFDFAAQNDVGTDFHALLELWNGDVAKLDSLLDPLKPELRRPLKAAALELRALPELADYWRTLATRPDFVQREFGLFLISPEYRLSGFADAIWFRSPEEICLIDWKSGASLKRLQSAERLEKFRRQLQLYARGFGKSFARIRLEVYGIELGATPRAARILSEYFPLT
jgi:ATP-dependent exoDNAse (exonuclease V) beta subunit